MTVQRLRLCMARIRRRSTRREIDEFPESDDLEAFGHQSGYCPECGEVVWDDAQYCGACESYFDTALSRPPSSIARRTLFRSVMLLLALAGFILLILFSI